jgi:hypothetical protein
VLDSRKLYRAVLADVYLLRLALIGRSARNRTPVQAHIHCTGAHIIAPGLAINSRGLTLFAPRHSMADDRAGAGGRGITDAAYNWRYK